MKFEILNVQHGFVAYAVAEDGNVVLFDCGYSPTCWPSYYLWAQGIRTIHWFFVTNYDEDHIAHLPMLQKWFGIRALTRNLSVNSAELCNLKTHPISPAMNKLLKMMNSYTRVISKEQIEPLGIQVQTFCNSYPLFTDTNNLSLLTFLDIGGISFALTGDLERQGWLQLLQNPYVCESLKRVNIFVASHHGRESGYCREVFDYCSPWLVIVSDGAIQYGTQKMASVYGQHATGGWFNRQGKWEGRKVLTTRNDGSILWQFN